MYEDSDLSPCEEPPPRERDAAANAPHDLNLPASVPPQTRSGKTGRYAVIAIAALMGILAIIGIGFGDVLGGIGIRRDKRVRYVATHSSPMGKVDLTFETVNGDTEQLTTRVRRGDWSLSFYAAPGSRVYVSVRNLESVGTVSCSISVDGKRIEQAQSSGASTTAICAGTVPQPLIRLANWSLLCAPTAAVFLTIPRRSRFSRS